MIKPKTFKSEFRIYITETKNLFSILADLNCVLDSESSSKSIVLNAKDPSIFYPSNFITLKEENIREELEHDLLKKLRNRVLDPILFFGNTPLYEPTYSTDLSYLINNVFDVVVDCYNRINERFEGRLFMSMIVGSQNESVIKTYPLNEMIIDPYSIYNVLEKHCSQYYPKVKVFHSKKTFKEHHLLK